MKFEEIIELLNKSGIDYFITGSYAVYLYTRNRDFKDIDIAIREEDIPLLEQILDTKRSLHFNLEGNTYSLIHKYNFEFGTFDIHRNSRLYEFGVNKFINESRIFKLGKEEFRVMSPETLFTLKLFFNRNNNEKQDWVDCLNMLERVELNISRIVYLCEYFGISDKLVEFSSVTKNMELYNLLAAYKMKKYIFSSF